MSTSVHPVDSPPGDSPPMLLSVPQSAKVLNVGARTVWRWIENGHINPVKLGRLVRIPRQELERIAREGIQEGEQ